VLVPVQLHSDLEVLVQGHNVAIESAGGQHSVLIPTLSSKIVVVVVVAVVGQLNLPTQKGGQFKRALQAVKLFRVAGVDAVSITLPGIGGNDAVILTSNGHDGPFQNQNQNQKKFSNW